MSSLRIRGSAMAGLLLLSACSLIVSPDDVVLQDDSSLGGAKNSDSGPSADGGSSATSGGGSSAVGDGGSGDGGSGATGGSSATGGGSSTGSATGAGGGNACNNTCAIGVECISGVCDPVTGGDDSGVHTCVVRKSGSLLCLGSGNLGALGRASTEIPIPSSDEFLPVVVGPDADSAPFLASAVQTAQGNTCALDLNGQIFCFGANFHGQNGTGDTAASRYPLKVQSDAPEFASRTFTQLEISQYATCALDDLGSVWCMGRSGFGGGGASNRTKAAKMVLSKTVTQIRMNGLGACALLEGGDVECWGSNLGGSLGRGSATPASDTTPGAASISGVKSLFAEGSVFCALTTLDELKCWGWNQTQLITTPASAAEYTPLTVDQGVSEAWVHGASLCYRKSGDTWCRGSTEYGTVGVSARPGLTSSMPFRATALDGVDVDFFGLHLVCGKKDGAFVCWGEMPYGGLPGGAATLTSPTSVVGAGLSAASDLTRISLGPTGGCATVVGGLRCWGNDDFVGQSDRWHSSTPLDVSGLINPTQLSVGQSDVCVIEDTRANSGERQAYCWGRTVSQPTLISLAGEETDVSVGTGYSCAIQGAGAQDDGPVYCWGANNFGQLGYDTAGATQSKPGSPVVGLTDAVQIASGYYHACALQATGSIACWGKGVNGQLGNGASVDSTTPVQVSGISSAVAVATGYNFSCAILASGAIQCWGPADTGRLGDGKLKSSNVPSTVLATGKKATSISLGFSHACASYEGGDVYCWGGNTEAQVDGSDPSARFTGPHLVPGVRNATQVSVNTDNGYGSCALSADRTAKCWGLNGYSALGSGSPIHSHLPVAMTLP